MELVVDPRFRTEFVVDCPRPAFTPRPAGTSFEDARSVDRRAYPRCRRQVVPEFPCWFEADPLHHLDPVQVVLPMHKHAVARRVLRLAPRAASQAETAGRHYRPSSAEP